MIRRYAAINFTPIVGINEFYPFFLYKSKIPNIFPFYRVYKERLLLLILNLYLISLSYCLCTKKKKIGWRLGITLFTNNWRVLKIFFMTTSLIITFFIDVRVNCKCNCNSNIFLVRLLYMYTFRCVISSVWCKKCVCLCNDDSCSSWLSDINYYCQTI
jgi:hypothetical protein